LLDWRFPSGLNSARGQLLRLTSPIVAPKQHVGDFWPRQGLQFLTESKQPAWALNHTCHHIAGIDGLGVWKVVSIPAFSQRPHDTPADSSEKLMRIVCLQLVERIPKASGRRITVQFR
jgi:hypothetical protein